MDGYIGLRIMVVQLGFHRTVPLVLHGAGWTHVGLKVLVGQAGFHRTVPLVLHETGRIPLDSYMYPT